ncbi:hypothetical protein [Bradyrhizobium elkanii]|uniref:hypothetical protein n=1 Tax=Bradyrhizobium elkanii TaxID=29448 RepID=UPI002169DA7A|nr:hypothetical protein [Bradyrhizobium elkanii]MCS3523520.1 hypothetical protein [Bradyrhizobium elkanii]MCS4071176.1 hypothetical protein [Bradyrhizobium elkanii]MCS4077807.1 hypothetical protein [Bradyrhizobium elkanii]MCW2123605.1 hypothetical protein [Bradyrhizobium elkanii]MCW2170352.1 hypothetical protein [Bradyrhizobium elkanii]
MIANSIKTKFASTLVTAAIETAWAMIHASERWCTQLDARDLGLSVRWRFGARVSSAGSALEALAERVAPRLGVDMHADVLLPIMERAYRA